jgi:hypothetical protein
MGKFINTSYSQTIDSLITGFKEKFNNPYYIHQDKAPTPTTYYNQNIEKSTLDEASKLQYSALGNDSPTVYNKIENTYLYGLEKIQVILENGDFGLEANAIEGEGITLPNTIIPYPGDYFSIKYLEKKLLFKVINVTPDTLENGSNFYMLNYKLDQLDEQIIAKQVVEQYTMIIGNLGTGLNTIVRSNDYNLAQQFDDILVRLKKYYKSLFLRRRVETFIFTYNNHNFYDPFMIEFLYKNKLMDGDDEYIYIEHQIRLPNTFILDYDKTIFRFIETKDKNRLDSITINTIAHHINDKTSIFANRFEDYFSISYNVPIINFDRIPTLDPELITAIIQNTLFDSNNKKIYNIIIKYFNNLDISSDDIIALENIDYSDTVSLFYTIPMVIYCIEYYIKNLLK